MYFCVVYIVWSLFRGENKLSENANYSTLHDNFQRDFS